MCAAVGMGAKPLKPRPPDKGAFPLDHLGECTAFKEKFMNCLRVNNFESSVCREESKEYLECRMDRELMAREPLRKLGFKEKLEEKSDIQPKTSE
nr:cytochrome c oxidase assembly protein COX19 [Pogona vitticeps]